jgi:hypothetical protein
MGADNRTVYYYAHLARYADGLAEGRFAQEGEVIGYVGDLTTGQKFNNLLPDNKIEAFEVGH